MPIAVYDAVQAGDDGRAALLAGILAAVAIVVLLVVNRFSRAGV
jgi:ABC-type molybdate transport system permease subunit